MTVLILGVLLWSVAHLFKRLLPGVRMAMSERLGDASKGVLALLIVIAIALLYFGYSSADFVPIYTPIAGIGHLNNLLMLISVFLFGAGAGNGVIGSKIRHPMLLGFLVWAVAHLLVNGDQASIILFGGLGIWALVSMVLIDAQDQKRPERAPGSWAGDARGMVISLVIFTIIAGIHAWLGKNPFLGTYG